MLTLITISANVYVIWISMVSQNSHIQQKNYSGNTMNHRQKLATHIQKGGQNFNHACGNPCSQHLKPLTRKTSIRSQKTRSPLSKRSQRSVNIQNIMT